MFVAYDEHTIHAVADTAGEALEAAREVTGRPEAAYQTAQITDAFGAILRVTGWSRGRRFTVRNGFLWEIPK